MASFLSRRKLNRTVAFDGVPMFRGLALMLQDARNHGWVGHVNSADRREGVAEKYGKMSQAALYAGWIAHKAGFAPANPPGRSTHELRSDGVAYAGPIGRPLSWWQLGIDVTNSEQLLNVLHLRGYAAFRPYTDPREAHHVNLSKSPSQRVHRLQRKARQRAAERAIVRARKAAERARLRDQKAAAQVGKRNGLSNALAAIQVADTLPHVGRPLALAMLEQESHGRNVFGHDPTIFAGAGKVTKAKYLRYRDARVKSGNRLMQGVGPMQLTWWEFQDAADRRGGCWVPRHNIAEGLTRLDRLIDTRGRVEGIRRYNGSGPAAQAYAVSVQAKTDVWATRLAKK